MSEGLNNIMGAMLLCLLLVMLAGNSIASTTATPTPVAGPQSTCWVFGGPYSCHWRDV